MAREHKLPPLSFDSSHSAQARFFGTPFQVGFHYVEKSGASMLKMICPNDLGYEGAEKCKICPSHPPATRMVAVAWDVRASKWCLYMAPTGTFKEIFDKCKDEGVTPDQLEAGDGPDVLLTKVGMATEIFVMPETIGKKRGEPVRYRDDDNWSLNNENKKPQHIHPPMERIVKAIYNNSIWRFCNTEAQARAENPRTQREDVPLDPMIAPPDGPLSRFLRAVRQQQPYQPLPPAQEGPIKAKPKGQPKQPPKPPEIAEDRWDII